MALFSLRKPRKEQAAPPSRTETVEAVRRRALHRLIGAAVLVVAGVIGFPLIFDNQPRPIPVDLPIEIADKDQVPPLQAPPTPAASAGGAVTSRVVPETPESAPVQPPSAEPARAAVADAPPPAVSASPAPAVAPVPSTPAARTEAAAPPAAPAAPRPADASEAQKARALLEGRAPAATAATGASAASAAARFVVQVGAFAEEQTLREVRRKVERAGFKTYTQVVTTKEGARTRVRVGPFEDRSKAQQAADGIRQLGLSPSVLTL